MTGVTVRTLESVGRCRADTRFMFVIVSSGWCQVLLQSLKYVTVSGDNMSSVQVLHHSKLIVVYRGSFNCNYIPAFATRVSGVLSVYPRMGGHIKIIQRNSIFWMCKSWVLNWEKEKRMQFCLSRWRLWRAPGTWEHPVRLHNWKLDGHKLNFEMNFR